MSVALTPAGFADLAGWAEDAHAAAFAAFRRSAIYGLEHDYKTGALGIGPEHLAPAWQEAASIEADLSDAEARAFFERHFEPHLIRPEHATTGFVTGFYEPEVEASAERSDNFRVPLLEVPDDLVKVDDSNRPEGMDPYLAFGRKTPDGIVEYFDRAAIEQGVLGDRARAIAWVENRVDAFFIHVQGAARLKMPDGSVRRITYAAKSGQRFTGPGRVLIELGEIAEADVTMQSIRKWFADHPDRINEILWRNRSYIFFREADVSDPSLGPVAAAKVPLTSGRSLAVDRLIHTFGTPFFIDAPSLLAFDTKPFRRLMIAQDTGSAIVGPARGDLFAGSGDSAGEIAGVVRHPADFYILVPRPYGAAA